MSLLGDLDTLRRAGILKPLGPRATIEVLRVVARNGFTPHIVHTIYGTNQPSKPALIHEGRTTTWGELLRRIRRLANHLTDLGAARSSVAIMLGNRPEFVEAEAAALGIGATTSFVNPRAPAAEAEALVERTKAKLLVTDREDVRAPAVLRVGEAYERAIASAPETEPHLGWLGGTSKLVIFTSGTTGRPKGAVRSLDDYVSPGAFAAFLRAIPLRADDVHLVVCPMYHASGSGFTAVASGLGNTLVIADRFEPDTFCRLVHEYRVTSTVVVPTMLHRLAAWDGAKRYDLSSLRVVVCTGAPLRQEVRARVREILGDVVHDLYGSTEMGWVSIASPSDQLAKPGTVGKPVDGVSVRICDADGHEVPRGAPGEVWASSALLMKEYVDDPDLTRERMRDGYVSVRDVGYLDEDGYLHLVDRADDMIISGGVNVYPATTEIALLSHPDVDECAVVGVGDAEWGQRVVAAVVPLRDVDPSDLVAWTKERVEAAAVPKEIRVVRELPKNDIGKIDRKRLAKEWET